MTSHAKFVAMSNEHGSPDHASPAQPIKKKRGRLAKAPPAVPPPPASVPYRTQGAQQFLAGRQRMLNEFDVAKTFSTVHEVRVHHGNVAESLFRKWLKAFLPKRYGVSAGYLISQGADESIKAPHFDVIIYDKLNAPTLWIETDPDSRAIPVENALAVIEVKATLTKKAALKARQHLMDLAPLLEDLDPPNREFPAYLPPGFFCGSVFFELFKDCATPEDTLEALRPPDLRGYWGSWILRGEGRGDETGETLTVRSEDQFQEHSTVGKQGTEHILKHARTKSKLVNAEYHSLILMWGELTFSRFAFDLLARLRGTYTPGRASSGHALLPLSSTKVRPPAMVPRKPTKPRGKAQPPTP